MGISRFSLKIYAVLLFMGVVPLLASAALIDDVLTFNQDLQNEAIATLDDVAYFHRAWAKAEAERVNLIGASLAREVDEALALRHPQRPAAGALPAASLAQAATHLRAAISRHEILVRAEVLDGKAVLIDVGPARMPPLDTMKIRLHTWRLASAEGEGHQLLGREGDLEDGQVGLRLTYGIDRSLSDRYDALGERRHLHRGLAALGGEQEGSLTQVYRNFYYIMLAMVILFTIGFALAITVPLSRRVGRLAQATEAVARGDLAVAVPVRGKDELARLTEQFNRMVSDLREARRSQAYVERMQIWQEVARRLAHEIKNPLTPLLLAIQQLDKTFDKYRDRPEVYRSLVSDVVEIVTEEVDTLRKLVKEFSEFARLPSPDTKARDLSDFVEQTLQSNPQFQEAGEIHWQGGPEAWVRLDPSLLRRVLVNIVQNAIEAAQGCAADPVVAVAVETDPGQGVAHVLVRDNGPGLTDEQIERLFEPYFTTKEKGTGLGLAIVKKIVLDHGGRIALTNREGAQGGGAEARITLPLIPSGQGARREEGEGSQAAASSPDAVEETDGEPGPLAASDGEPGHLADEMGGGRAADEGSDAET